jgi:hypothetical protein
MPQSGAVTLLNSDNRAVIKYVSTSMPPFSMTLSEFSHLALSQTKKLSELSQENWGGVDVFFIRRNFHKISHALPNHTSSQCQLFIYFNLLMDLPFLICTSVIGEHNISFSINSCGVSTKKRARTNLRSIPSQALDRRSVQKQQMKRNKSLLLPINKTS